MNVVRHIFLGFLCVSFVILNAKEVLFTFDSLLSSYAQKECQDAFTSALENQSLSQALEYTAKRLPYIKKLSLSAASPSVYALSVVSKEPCALINSHNFLLLEDNSLINESSYAHKLVQALPRCRLIADRADASLHHSFTTFVRNLDAHILRMFDMTWHNENRIEFVKPAEPVVIIAGNMTHVTMKLLMYCMHIAQQVFAQDAGKKGIKGYAVDIRFKDQIIVYRV